MDEKLAAWGRAVKQRNRSALPTLWYFTDAARGGDPLRVVATLPSCLSGVVFRHQDATLGKALARLCRARRIALVVAGDARLAAMLRVGVHLRGGAWPGLMRVKGLRTASAHNQAQCVKARRAGADIIFLSPAFRTQSHPGAAALGWGWMRLARPPGRFYALGGVTGGNVRGLGSRCQGAGVITAFE